MVAFLLDQIVEQLVRQENKLFQLQIHFQCHIGTFIFVHIDYTQTDSEGNYQNQLSQIYSQFPYIIVRMKKFLQLKKTIVDSKNQPVLIQTYLDSIRSSCYKLSIPDLCFHKVSCEDPIITDLTAKMDVQNLCKGGETRTVRKQKEKKSIEEESQIKSKQIDDLFSQISQRFHSSEKNHNCHSDIIASILEQLNLLQKQNSSYHEAINLIRKIINAMGTNQSMLISQPSAHKTQFQKTKILTESKSHFKSYFQLEQTQENDIKQRNSRKNQCRNLLNEIQLEECPLNIKSVRKRCKPKGRISKTEYDEEEVIKLGSPVSSAFDSEKKESSMKKSRISQQSDEKQRFCTIKYKKLLPGEHFSSQYEELDDKDNEDNNISLSREQRSEEEEESSLDNTMKSYDLNQWSQRLSRIEQAQNEEESESALVQENLISFQNQISIKVEQNNQSNESIEHRKIRYMLESQSTQKKNPKEQNKKNIHYLMKKQQFVPPEQKIWKNLFGNSDEKQNIPIITDSLEINRKKMVGEQKGKKDDSSKATIKQIVGLLNKKYNRKVEFKNI